MIRRRQLLIFSITTLFLLYGCNRNYYVSDESLKSRFEKGDKIIINNWLLLEPSSIIDSIPITNKLSSALILKKGSAKSQYGYLSTKYKIIELTIPNLDSRLFGNCLDKKVVKYLNPKKKVYYFIDGTPCETYSIALNFLKNKDVIEINTIEPKSAMKLWGPRLGKNGAILINTNRKSNVLIIYK